VNIRIEKEAFEEILEEIQLRFEAIKLILGDAYENEDVTSLGLADGRTVRIQYEPHAKVVRLEREPRMGHQKWPRAVC
jgi:hypothetical protein